MKRKNPEDKKTSGSDVKSEITDKFRTLTSTGLKLSSELSSMADSAKKNELPLYIELAELEIGKFAAVPFRQKLNESVDELLNDIFSNGGYYDPSEIHAKIITGDLPSDYYHTMITLFGEELMLPFEMVLRRDRGKVNTRKHAVPLSKIPDPLKRLGLLLDLSIRRKKTTFAERLGTACNSGTYSLVCSTVANDKVVRVQMIDPDETVETKLQETLSDNNIAPTLHYMWNMPPYNFMVMQKYKYDLETHMMGLKYNPDTLSSSIRGKLKQLSSFALCLDIKPKNIVLNNDSDVRIIDFGGGFCYRDDAFLKDSGSRYQLMIALLIGFILSQYENVHENLCLGLMQGLDFGGNSTWPLILARAKTNNDFVLIANAYHKKELNTLLDGLLSINYSSSLP